MKKAVILIVEDEVVIADGIRLDLEELGYAVPMPACATYDEAVASLKLMRPDLVLLDIRLKGTLSGIDLAAFINEHFGIPFLFLTSQLSPALISGVRQVNPSGFLTKPYLPDNLWANIELGLCRKEVRALKAEIMLNGTKGRELHSLSDLIYLEAEGSYTRYWFEDKDTLQRKTLKQAMDEIPTGHLVQIHRSFAVNPLKVTAFSNRKIFVHDREFPISRTKQEEIMSVMHMNLG